MKQPLVIITGPTAVGKTGLSLQLAAAINGEIISADSMQVYKYMNIGTAKITPEEMGDIPHYLIDEYLPDEEFNVTRFQARAKELIQDIISRGKIPILVGGTGFYIQSVLYDIAFSDDNNDYSYRDQLELWTKENGPEALHQRLAEVDPESAQAIHPNNTKRVIRALEYFHLTGQQISVHNKEQQQNSSPYAFQYFVLTMNRDTLYQRIDQRVDQMIAEGLVAEVKALRAKGYDKGLVSMEGLGYKEILEYLDGNITLEEAVTILKRDTRHFAKRQLTWFKREKEVTTIDKDHFPKEEDLLQHMLKQLQEHQILPT